MDSSLIIVLAIILFILIILNHMTFITVENTNATCSQTLFGCCPDGVNSKINFFGTNCPGYKPSPGYYPIPLPPPQPVPIPVPEPVPAPQPLPPKPIGGCSGTRYGCCPNNMTPKIDVSGSNCIINQKPVGGCSGTRYGCCPNKMTPKIDEYGSNCRIHPK